MEACPKIQMVSFDTKLCNYEGPPITDKISTYIFTHYQENPASFQKEIDELLQLREVRVPPSDKKNQKKILNPIYDYLCLNR